MHITVHYLAQLRKAAGAESERIDVAAPCTLATLLASLAERHDEAFRTLLLDRHGKLQPTLLVFVGEAQARPMEEHGLQDGDVVTILTPMAGG